MSDELREQVIEEFGSPEKALDEIDEVYGTVATEIRLSIQRIEELEQERELARELLQELDEIQEEVEARQCPGSSDFLQEIEQARDRVLQNIEKIEEQATEASDAHEKLVQVYKRAERVREAIRDEC